MHQVIEKLQPLYNTDATSEKILAQHSEVVEHDPRQKRLEKGGCEGETLKDESNQWLQWHQAEHSKCHRDTTGVSSPRHDQVRSKNGEANEPLLLQSAAGHDDSLAINAWSTSTGC